MANEGAATVARARALIGTRFRPQGRSAEQGLDCVGVVMMAAGIGRERTPDDYRLRGSDIDAANAGLAAMGFVRLPSDRGEPGDVLVAKSGPGQLHAAVLTPGGYVHAHAGLRRVVETPGALPWPVLAAWRYSGAGR
ncbi:peptidoglycan endopeptidase [Sphingosinicella sp.]|uniref:peptidoglycan endopeptidase n=1 Tax=Sphingosinicella sp. TaxID=1917971 RepID=UPI00403792EC